MEGRELGHGRVARGLDLRRRHGTVLAAPRVVEREHPRARAARAVRRRVALVLGVGVAVGEPGREAREGAAQHGHVDVGPRRRRERVDAVGAVAPDERRGREIAREPLARGRREPRVARELALLAQEGLAQLRRGDVGLEHRVLDEAPAAAPQVREEDDGLGRRAHGRDGDGPTGMPVPLRPSATSVTTRMKSSTMPGFFMDCVQIMWHSSWGTSMAQVGELVMKAR